MKIRRNFSLPFFVKALMVSSCAIARDWVGDDIDAEDKLNFDEDNS